MLRETFLEIDFKRLAHNLDVFRQKIRPETKILANLKGNAYGMDAILLGKFLEQKNVDYFSVAYINEAVRLRKAGIKAKLLIFNPSTENIQALIDYDLEPEVSSLRYLNILIDFLKHKNITGFPVHIKLDTGMHRAGIMQNELNELINLLQAKQIQVKSVFSHLSAAEDTNEDKFTLNQIKNFEKMSDFIKKNINDKFFRHLLNTAGVFRFAAYQFDMIRPGLGIFGYNLVKSNVSDLQPIAQFKTKINQIKILQQNETVGYNRNYKVEGKTARIALLPVGYADGLSRKLGQNNWKVSVNGKPVPIVGNVSMDTISIDVTEAECQAGDEVIIFDNKDDVYRMANLLKTICYEVISSITYRVPRYIVV